ncbi:MAG: AtpZ/AtpI family protein [Flavobacteriales bacterium]
MKKENSKNKRFNRYLVLSSAGLQMGITIYLGAYLGKWLDEKYPSDKNWYTIICTLAAVVLALWQVLRQVNRLNDEE